MTLFSNLLDKMFILIHSRDSCDYMLADCCTLKQRPANLPSYIHKKTIFITIQIIHSKSNVCLKTSHKFYNNHKKY